VLPTLAKHALACLTLGLSAIAIATASATPLLATGCCSQGTAAGNGCEPGAAPAFLDLSCTPTDLQALAVSGACAAVDQPPQGQPLRFLKQLSVLSQAGDCHVTLTFSSGFVFSTDIPFVGDPQPCGCAPYVHPSSGQTTIQVDNPASTCLSDGGGD